MANLTQEARLVRYVSSIDPVPDHYLVIFKKAGDGRKFRTCLSPGEKLKRSFLESPDAFIPYAVPRDEDLRHRFVRSYQTHDQVHSFNLNFTIEYRVSDPRSLVERLETDPLQRLEQEIDAALVLAMKTLDWPAIEREQIDLEQVLFPDPAAQPLSDLARLRRFASAQGLEIRRIAVARRLHHDEIKVPVARKQHLQKREILVLEQDTKALEQTGTLNLLGQEKGFERRQRVADGIADATVQAFGQATGSIRSFSDIRNAVGEVAAIHGTVLEVAAGGGGQLPGGPTPAALPDASGGLSAGTPDPLRNLLTELTERLGSLACDPSQRRQLLSLSLHLVAEALRGDEADAETLDRYAGAVEGRFAGLMSLLNRDQIKFLSRLRNTEALKRELG